MDFDIENKSAEDTLRLRFWSMYYDDVDEVIRAVLENPAEMDAEWLLAFPDAEEFKRIMYDKDSLQI